MYEPDFEDEGTKQRQRGGIPSEAPPPPPTPGYQDFDYWAERGVGTDQIFDEQGQTRPGWARTGQGYEQVPVKEATSIDYAPQATPIPPPPTTAGGGGPAPAFQPAAAAPAPTVNQPGITDEVTKLLMQRLKDLQNPGDVASDPIYQQAVKQYQIGQLRSADKQRKALAERSAATTGTTSSGGFNVGVRGIQERAGENAAQYRSGLSLDRLQSREQQLVQAIQMARAVGQDDIANQLELQRLQLQQELGRGDLALRSELGHGQLGLGYDNLGFNYADLITRANRDATIAALQGGGG